MKYYVVLVLCIFGFSVGCADTSVKTRPDAKMMVISVCQLLNNIKGYHFNMNIVVDLKKTPYKYCLVFEPKGLWKNPSFCYFNTTVPEFAGAQGTLNFYYENNKWVVGFIQKNEKNISTWDNYKSDENNQMIDTPQVFTPFYKLTNLENFFKEAKFIGEDNINGFSCYIIEAMIPKENWKDALNLEKMLYKITPRNTTLLQAIYKFWIGKKDQQLHKMQQNQEYQFPNSEQENSFTTFNIEINMILYDHDKNLDIDIPDVVKDIFTGKK
jgi:hypothetical protein